MAIRELAFNEFLEKFADVLSQQAQVLLPE